jgi:DNA polymerase-3 subunit gamma/tau
MQNYTVLARKYRPNNLDGLIGQEAMVRTLKNAIANNRLAHAFLLTGIRGVGKTSTARILARTLNAIPDDQTLEGHIDIVEMDAASHTGVDDVREIIESARYKPVSAPYKIFIIDEVHMLSKSAFNALLKTLEEPPAHVKFIFATTEIRKVPVTILSRCQRFDLRRIDAAMIAEHLKTVAGLEKIKIDDGAVSLIANAAEGSMRDSLSLLDQAIAFSQGEVTRAQVQEMLGFADRSQIIELFELVITGNIIDALTLFENICHTSSEPITVIQNLLEIAHLATRLKLDAKLKPADIAENELKKVAEIATKLPINALTLIWQMLLKSAADMRIAPNPKHAGEMALIRVAFGTELPEPDPTKMRVPQIQTTAPAAPNQQPATSNQQPSNFAELVDLFKANGELLTHNELMNDVHLVSFKDCQLEIRLSAAPNKDLPHKITAKLNDWTGKRWVVIVSNAEGQAPLAGQKAEILEALMEQAQQTPEMQKILEFFPDAKITDVKINSEFKKTMES